MSHVKLFFLLPCDAPEGTHSFLGAFLLLSPWAGFGQDLGDVPGELQWAPGASSLSPEFCLLCGSVAFCHHLRVMFFVHLTAGGH